MLNYFKKMTLFNRVRFFICLCSVIAGTAIIIIGNSQIDELQQQHKDNASTVKSLTDQVASMSNTATPDTVEIKQNLKSCKDAGEAIANGQNDYCNGNRDRSAITAELSTYFDTNDANARVQWYDMGDVSKHWTWKFETTYDFTGSSVPVLWTCRLDDTHELLAYCTGTYDVSSELFSDVKWYQTTVGASYIMGTPAKGDA